MIHVVAAITAKPGQRASVLQAFKDNVPAVLAEAGCSEYGAVVGLRANKGVFITTSGYTSQAIEFARSVERVVLVDGPRLAELMIAHEVSVSARTVKIPKIDSDYFDEESTNTSLEPSPNGGPPGPEVAAILRP